MYSVFLLSQLFLLLRLSAHKSHPCLSACLLHRGKCRKKVEIRNVYRLAIRQVAFAPLSSHDTQRHFPAFIRRASVEQVMFGSLRTSTCDASTSSRVGGCASGFRGSYLMKLQGKY